MSTQHLPEKSIVFEDHNYERLFYLEEAHWFFQARWNILKHLLAWFDFTGDVALDLGCGTGTASLQLMQYCQHVESLDLSMTALRLALQRGVPRPICADGTVLPYADESFDLITALDVIEHIVDDVAAMGEIRRILTPGGLGIIYVPAYQFLWSNMDDISHHIRRYTRAVLTQRLRQAGLEVQFASYVNTTLLPLQIMMRLWRRFTHAQEDETPEMNVPPRWINDALRDLLTWEAKLAVRAPLPAGGSIIAVCTRM